MPGATFDYAPASGGVAGRSATAQAPASPAVSSDGMRTDVGFLIWLVVFGVVLPSVVFGGLRAGGFRFVFKGV